MSEEIQIYIGDTMLSSQASNFLDPSASRANPIDIPSDKLASIGGRLAALFAAMRPNVSIFEGDSAAEAFELEVGFSLEMAPGSLLKIILSPKVGLSCKAKMTWKK